MQSNHLVHKVTTIMADSRRQPFFSLATGLLALSHLYSIGMRLWRLAYKSGWRLQKRLDRPVVSIGNLTVGGTGKTPFTIFLARELLKRGYRPAVVSRGYKSQGGKRSPVIVSDGRQMLSNLRMSGDEPMLLAGSLPGVPVVVGAERHLAGKLAIERFHPDMILLDDGFQHLRLHRDLNILLVDAFRPLADEFVFPRGMLREPAGAAIDADVVVLTRSRGAESGPTSRAVRRLSVCPVFRTAHRPVVRTIAAPANLNGGHGDARLVNSLQEQKVFAFSALARNDTFLESLAEMGMEIVGSIGFRDHHNFSKKELQIIRARAIKAGATALATTDKDYTRLGDDFKWPLPLIVAGVEIDFGTQKERWERFFDAAIEKLLPKKGDVCAIKKTGPKVTLL